MADTRRKHSSNTASSAEALLDEVRQLLVELHPQQQHPVISLDSTLDRELGLDSLARVELLLRIERHFDVHLPEELVMSAETPRDLLKGVLGAAALAPEIETYAGAGMAEEAGGEPRQAATLVEVLDWHADKHPERPHIHFYGHKGKKETITYGALRKDAEAVCAGLRHLDLRPGQSVGIMLPSGKEFFAGFYGILLAGGVPVPVYPPIRLRQIEEHMRRQAGILTNAQIRILITFDEVRPLGRLLKSQIESLQHVLTVTEIAATRDGRERPVSQPQDIALLQYTSGSTGNPKGVVLTHANLLANIRAMGQAAGIEASDVFVSWLPLYHDMGLIGACMGSLYYAVPLVLMSPLSFMARPQRWLWAIHEHRGTISPAPNFAYELCLRAIDDTDIQGLDLSSWRLAFNGAEPVSPDTIERFSERFSTYGFQRRAMTPVYGLAEASVGLAFPPPGRGPVIDRIKRNTFTRSGRAVPAEGNEAHVLRFVACGQPIPGHQIRIVDGAGREVAEREEGRLQFSGPSATSGYFRNAEATVELYDGPWLNSGDLAYMAGGEIYLTGRAKDIIIRAGRNIYPQEVEDAVGEIPRIRKGCVAVFASRDEASTTERLVILAETREKRPEQLDKLRQRVTETVVDILGAPPDEVVLASPNTVLKTSSGKIRRAASREIYEHGKIGATRPSIHWQLLRLAMTSILPVLRHAMRTLRSLFFAGWAWAWFCLLAALVWLTLLWLPGLGQRRQFVRATARLFLRLVAVPLIVHGQENLPGNETFVLVANHTSYLDGMMLTAALPCDLTYVVKRELEKQFVPRVFLHRIGAEFVERFDPQEGAADIAHLAEAVRQGRSMVILPEGTFGRAPGLLTFHMGAFVVAAQAGVPVVPVAIRGTRSMLRAHSWFPHRGIASIIISSPISPTGTDWAAAIKLRDEARRKVLQHCGEPDLLDS